MLLTAWPEATHSSYFIACLIFFHFFSDQNCALTWPTRQIDFDFDYQITKLVKILLQRFTQSEYGIFTLQT